MGDFLTVYEPLLEAGDDVLSIHLSGGISGTVEAARQARDALIERGVAPERIEVLDSDTGAAGHGLMAIAAKNAAREGADLAGAADAARRLRERMTIIFAVDTLEYLRRGGRIGGAQAWIGSALKIKPILSINREILPIERVRTAGRAFERLVEHLASQRDDGADVFFIQHIQAHDIAARLAERGAEIYGRAAGVRVRARPRDRRPRGAGAVRRHGAAGLGSGPGVATAGASARRSARYSR